MKQATARFRRPANGGVRLGRARSAARLLMFVLLLAALVLLTLAVFYYTRNTAQAMEAELCQKMLVSAGQTRNNIDYRFEQVKESASGIDRHIVSLSQFRRGHSRCNWKNTPRYAARCLNSWTSI